jgi:Protein of unknown function (DUF3179)
VWTRTVNGRTLHFYLAGINNQNFLMRDRETGTWWQQVTGKAIYGSLEGAALDLVLSDELTFGEWRSEFPDGRVLAPIGKFAKDYDSNWEPDVAKLPVVISFPGTELKSRDVVIGLIINGAARAYLWETFVKESPIIDHVNGVPLLLALGPDGKSLRAFVSRIEGRDAEFFLQTEGEAAPELSESKNSSESVADKPSAPGLKDKSEGDLEAKPGAPAAKTWLLVDNLTASQWNFQGCAVSGRVKGTCLDRVPALKDYWFDWRNYHHDTTVYKRQ